MGKGNVSGTRNVAVWVTVVAGTLLSLWACTRGQGPTSPTAGAEQSAGVADNLVRGAATVGPAPVGPSSRPVGPTTRPIGPTSRPVGPTARPVGPTAAPPPGGGTPPPDPGATPSPTDPLRVTIGSVASGRAYQTCDCRTDPSCGDRAYVDDTNWQVAFNCGDAILIRTAYGDRNAVANPFLTFSVSRRADVAVLIEGCGANNPSWLAGLGFGRTATDAQFNHPTLPPHIGTFWFRSGVEGSLALGPNVDDLTPPCDPSRVMYVVYVFEPL